MNVGTTLVGREAALPVEAGMLLHFVARGACFVPQAEPGAHVLYLLVEGRALYVHATDDGKEAAAGIIGPGETFVYRPPALPGSPDAYVEALEDLRFLILRDDQMEELAATAPELAAQVMQALMRRCEDLKAQASDLSLGCVRARLLRLLLRLADRHAVDDGGRRHIVPALKHQDLAALVGACRETVTSTLADLARAGVVRTGRCSLWVDVGRARQALAH